jgi:hypothetical protein
MDRQLREPLCLLSSPALGSRRNCAHFALRSIESWYNASMPRKPVTELHIPLDQPQPPARVLKIVDTKTNVTYFVVRDDVYEKYRSLLEDDVEFDIREAYPLMGAAAQAAGLADPAEDIYDDLDPRRQP